MSIDAESPSAAVDQDRWPDVAEIPGGPGSAVAGRVAAALLRRAARRLPVRVTYPDGSSVGSTDPALPTLVLLDPVRFARRVGRHGLVGFGESYMAGEWTAPDLAGVLTVFAAELPNLVPRPLQRLRPLTLPRQPRHQINTRDQARRNISEHYDLSNDLFSTFLDETLTYSSALFDIPQPRFADLAGAQRRKIDRLLDMARVGPGSRVLEIGTGWGELSIQAARRGAHVRSITLSREQQHLARCRVSDARLCDRVHIDLCDYRDVKGRYDAVLSVEMIEAVGYRYWPVYFRRLDELVTPGGRVALQAITMPHSRMLASRNTHTWIQKYVFPGGLLPSTDVIEEITAQQTALRTVDKFSLRPDYAATLRLWRQRFSDNGDTVADLGFDASFRRLWEFYLAYSEAGFRSGYLDVFQWTFERSGDSR